MNWSYEWPEEETLPRWTTGRFCHCCLERLFAEMEADGAMSVMKNAAAWPQDFRFPAFSGRENSGDPHSRFVSLNLLFEDNTVWLIDWPTTGIRLPIPREVFLESGVLHWLDEAADLLQDESDGTLAGQDARDYLDVKVRPITRGEAGSLAYSILSYIEQNRAANEGQPGFTEAAWQEHLMERFARFSQALQCSDENQRLRLIQAELGQSVQVLDMQAYDFSIAFDMQPTVFQLKAKGGDETAANPAVAVVLDAYALTVPKEPEKKAEGLYIEFLGTFTHTPVKI